MVSLMPLRMKQFHSPITMGSRGPLSRGPLKEDSLDIYQTTSFGVGNFTKYKSYRNHLFLKLFKN